MIDFCFDWGLGHSIWRFHVNWSETCESNWLETWSEYERVTWVTWISFVSHFPYRMSNERGWWMWIIIIFVIVWLWISVSQSMIRMWSWWLLWWQQQCQDDKHGSGLSKAILRGCLALTWHLICSSSCWFIVTLWGLMSWLTPKLYVAQDTAVLTLSWFQLLRVTVLARRERELEKIHLHGKEENVNAQWLRSQILIAIGKLCDDKASSDCLLRTTTAIEWVSESLNIDIQE